MTENLRPRRKWPFRLSLTLNVIFLLCWSLNYLNSPTYKLGVLTQDVKAGFFIGDSVFINIPKGTTVRDISQQGLSAIGQFENNRFEIVVTSERDIVNYNLPKDSIATFGNFYSADNKLEKE
ncbi:hypothetical protein ACM55H_00915 [Flavobacterium sp. ZT3R17]|uniref:hypothetical protein n=1 Tax=Flavobacterium cryoconiti TaxID=3398736 RepID=UPI003A8AC406